MGSEWVTNAPKRPLRTLDQMGCKTDYCKRAFEDTDIMNTLQKMYNLLDYRVNQSGNQINALIPWVFSV